VLADWLNRMAGPVQPSAADLAQHVTDAVKPALAEFAQSLQTVEWSAAAIAAGIKTVLQAHQLKMPQLAMPVRVLVLGTPQTPSLDQVLALSDRDRVVGLIRAGL
jgi:glutamyl-tRNA synthetase